MLADWFLVAGVTWGGNPCDHGQVSWAVEKAGEGRGLGRSPACPSGDTRASHSRNTVPAPDSRDQRTGAGCSGGRAPDTGPGFLAQLWSPGWFFPGLDPAHPETRRCPSGPWLPGAVCRRDPLVLPFFHLVILLEGLRRAQNLLWCGNRVPCRHGCPGWASPPLPMALPSTSTVPFCFLPNGVTVHWPK